MLAQQEDLRKDDEKFLKGRPISVLGASMIQTQEERLAGKTIKSWWSYLMIGANLSLLPCWAELQTTQQVVLKKTKRFFVIFRRG